MVEDKDLRTKKLPKEQLKNLSKLGVRSATAKFKLYFESDEGRRELTRLRSLLAYFYGIAEKQIFAGNGTRFHYKILNLTERGLLNVQHQLDNRY